LPVDALATLLPEDASAIEQLLGLLAFDSDALLADLAASVERHREQGPALLSFAMPAADARDVQEAVAAVASTLSGPNRRGRALAIICRKYQGVRDA
jgi:hypothetical protein